MPIVITRDNYEQEVLSSSLPVVIDIYATWCGPCQQMHPIIEEIEKEYGQQYKFVKINVDESRDLSIQFGVTSIPTFVFIKNGQIKGKATGYMSKQDILARIQEAFGA